MKILITILLALFISSHANADLAMDIINTGEVLASGLRDDTGTMIMIMRYENSDGVISTWRCYVSQNAELTCRKI
jgi:hypothetical protein